MNSKLLARIKVDAYCDKHKELNLLVLEFLELNLGRMDVIMIVRFMNLIHLIQQMLLGI